MLTAFARKAVSAISPRSLRDLSPMPPTRAPFVLPPFCACANSGLLAPRSQTACWTLLPAPFPPRPPRLLLLITFLQHNKRARPEGPALFWLLNWDARISGLASAGIRGHQIL